MTTIQLYYTWNQTGKWLHIWTEGNKSRKSDIIVNNENLVMDILKSIGDAPYLERDCIHALSVSDYTMTLINKAKQIYLQAIIS